MNESITIKGVASYSPTTPEVLNISKQNILIFGLNGTGKSTVSNFLYKPDKYPSCSLNIDGDFTPIVYNQTFVDENFVNSSVQEGVFTLSKDNADLEVRIAEKSRLRDKLREKYRELGRKVNVAEQAKVDANETAIEEVFKHKHIIEKTSLEPFLTGYKRPKVNFYNQVKTRKGVTSDSIDDLDKEYRALNQFDKNLPKSIALPIPPQLSEEDIALLNEPILGASSSQLSAFVSELNNQNWVRVGKDNYLKDKQTKCPFCQKETIDDDLRSELSALFDKTYDSSVEKVKLLEHRYNRDLSNYIEFIRNSFSDCTLYDSEKNQAEPLIELLERAYQDNLSLIQSKLEKPSLSVTLNDYDEKLKPLTDLVEEINKAVGVVVTKAKKFKESEDDIRQRMWDSVRHQADGIFSIEESLKKEKEREIASLKKLQERLKSVGTRVNERINTLRSRTSNIDDTIARINENLKTLGLTSFEIVASTDPEHKNYFVLSRGDSGAEGEKVFHSLSEGEKTLITFLYFIEKCNGSMSKDTDIADKEKLVVVDDPISSLSQNYIYDIASLLHTKIIKGNRFKKVIVLTHSLFFYQELLKLAPNNPHKFKEKYDLYRLNKKQYSTAHAMDKGELKNDYQSLWQIIKDVIDGKANPVVLPNVMRNIIEYYFGFVHKKDKLADILNDLAEREPEQGHKAFYRYINRGSHSDPTNIGFMIEIDAGAYLERFRTIFVESKDEEHYTCMMDS